MEQISPNVNLLAGDSGEEGGLFCVIADLHTHTHNPHSDVHFKLTSLFILHDDGMLLGLRYTEVSQ